MIWYSFDIVKTCADNADRPDSLLVTWPVIINTDAERLLLDKYKYNLL